jgi:hypothetical protein
MKPLLLVTVGWWLARNVGAESIVVQALMPTPALNHISESVLKP